MNKFIVSFFVLLVAGIQFSCDSIIIETQFIEFTANGKTYKEKISGFFISSSDNDTCLDTQSKQLLDYQNSGFDLYIQLIHNRYDRGIDLFTKSRSTDIFDQSKTAGPCHLDIITEYKDNTESKGSVTTLKSGTASITRVEDVDSDDEDNFKDYKVEGNFSGIFATSTGKESQVSGNFSVKIRTDVF